MNLRSNWGANTLSNSCRLCCLRSRKYKFKTEAIREARAREQARGAQGPGNPEQARRGEGGKGRGGEGRREGGGEVELLVLFFLELMLL